jgi:hypothetical protein
MGKDATSLQLKSADYMCTIQNTGLPYMLPATAGLFDSLYQVERKLLSEVQYGIAAKCQK